MPTHKTTVSAAQLEGRNIIDLIKQDHEMTRALFEKVQNSGKREVAARQKLFTQLEEDLQVHMEGEERFLYPALEQHEEARDKVLESYEEHQLSKTMLGSFKSLAVDDERWKAKLSVLHEVVEHHMKEEEREVFKLARKALDKHQMEQIALQFLQHKREGKKPTHGAPVAG
jgi:iron-sulfur cluster repair protein YtfE (RIC family)